MTRRRRSRRRAPKTAAQIAASKRNLEKARAARQYGHLSPGTYIIGNDGVTRKISKPKPVSVKTKKSVSIKLPKPLTGNAIRKQLPGVNIKFHPYTGKPYDLRDTGGKEIPLIGLKGANEWLKANTTRRRRGKNAKT